MFCQIYILKICFKKLVININNIWLRILRPLAIKYFHRNVLNYYDTNKYFTAGTITAIAVDRWVSITRTQGGAQVGIQWHIHNISTVPSFSWLTRRWGPSTWSSGCSHSASPHQYWHSRYRYSKHWAVEASSKFREISPSICWNRLIVLCIDFWHLRK